MADKAENYAWSSAPAHCGLRSDPVLTGEPLWQRRFAGIGDWSAWLAETDEPESLQVLRSHTDKGLPCGSTIFIETLENLTERLLQYRPPGRPRKSGS